MRLLRPTHLRTRLLLIAALALVPALAAIVYAYRVEQQRAKVRVMAESERLARLAAAQQAAPIEGAARLLLTLSHVAVLRGGDAAACRELLVDVLQDHPGYVNLSVASPDGSVFCSGAALNPRTVKGAAGQPWFERALRSESPVAGDVQTSAVTGRPAIIAAIRLPMLYGPPRVLAATLDLNQLARIVEHAGLPPGAAVRLIDDSGRVIAGFPAGEDDGVARVYVSVPVNASIATHFSVAFGVEEEASFAEAGRIVRGYLWLLALASVGGAIAMLAASHVFVLRPVEALEAAARRFASGDLSARAGIPTTVAEIASLGNALDDMAGAVYMRQLERDRAEQELRASHTQYRLLFDENPHPMWVYDLETLAFLEVNSAAIRKYGYSRQEFLAMRIADIRPPEDVPRLAAEVQRLRAGLPRSAFSWRHCLKSGETVEVVVSSTKLTWRDRPAMLVAVQDVTDRRRAEHAEQIVRESEDRFRRITETITEVFWMAEVPLRALLYISPGYERIWGRSREALIASPGSFLDSIHPADYDRAIVMLESEQRGDPFDYEYRIVRPDGEVRWIWDRGYPVDDGGPVTRYVGVAQDVTERHRADEHTRLLGRALESITDIVTVTDLEDRFTFVNQAFLDTYGYTQEEVIGRTPELVRAPHLSEELQRTVYAKTHEGGWRGQLTNRRKDGTSLEISLSTSVIRDGDGRPLGLLGVSRDITERLAAERALKAAEERMRFALEAARVGVWETDLRTGRSYWSETCERMHGIAPGRFGGTVEDFLAAVHPEDRGAVSAAIDHAVRNRTDVTYEYQASWPDGTLRRIRTTGRFTFDQGGAPVRGAGIAEDITDRRSLEDQLRQAQKMEALGQLAGGIAHDFNNLLTAILGYSMFVADSFEPGDERRRDVAEIKRAAERASDLTRQLLAFSRKQILSPRVVHLGDVVSELTPMLRRLLGETIDLRAVVGERGHVKADAGQIEQVLMNLAVNARDAMPGGGRLTVETADVTLDHEYARAHPSVRPGAHVMIAITDTGSGMDAATQRRLFEPFFTTKPKGKGTGLGLATVYGIVKQSGGTIWVHSEIGVGTTFRIYLPIVDAPVEAPAITPPRVPGGSETILLVEDEQIVREFAERVLSRHGYRVHAEGDARRAVEFGARPETRIDLVLSDVVMPELCGRAVVERIVEQHAGVRVLYMSGYTDDTIVEHGVLQEGTALLQKPFSAQQLLRKVRDVLDA